MFPREREELLLKRRKLILLLMILQMRKKTGEKRKTWTKEIFKERKNFGDFHCLIPRMREHDVQSFRNYLRVTPTQLDKLVEKVSPHLFKKDSRFRKSISPAEKVCLTLRLLASGDSMRSLSYSFRIGYSTTSKIIAETCQVLWNVLHLEVLSPPKNEGDWRKIAEGFDTKWNFPFCLGAIDGKHITIQAPHNSGTLFYNYKNNYSIVLLAVCDSNYRFTVIEVGDYGHHSDGGVLNASSFGRSLLTDSLPLPVNNYLPGTNICVPYVFVGDEAFGLKPCLMRPYAAQNLNVEKRIFNYRLCRARRIIENSFGILAARWRIFRKPIQCKINTIDIIVKTACALHNFIMIDNADFDGDSDVNGESLPGSWRADAEAMDAFQPIISNANNYSRYASSVRDSYAKYFNSEIGSRDVPWQYERISRGLL